MGKALSVVLGASLGISPLWAIAAESDVEQTLRDYQQRLEKLEQQQVESSLRVIHDFANFKHVSELTDLLHAY